MDYRHAFATLLSAGALLLAAPAEALVAQGPTERIAVPTSLLRSAHDLGRAPAQMPVHLALLLRYRHSAQLESLVRAQSDRNSPLYHRFLTPQQFRESFAASDGDVRHALAQFAAAGFVVDSVAANRTVADVSAPATTVERFFGTQLHRVTQPDAGIRYANVLPATIPPQVRGVVASVAGLDNLKVPDLLGGGADEDLPTLPSSIGGPILGPDGAYGPGTIANVYDLPVQHGFDGSGRTIGLALYADYHDADLTNYLAEFGITRTGPPTVRVAVDGGAGFSRTSGYTSLDVETMIGLTPGAGFYLYLFPGPQQNDILDVMNRAVSDDAVDVFYTGFALCEASSTNLAPDIDSIAEQAVALGITVVAASGDAGAFACGTFDLAEDATPADSPHVTAAGGTVLTIDAAGHYIREKAWSGSGGGPSTVFPTPSYQSGIPGLGGTRGVPDVAFDAGRKTGVSILYKAHWIGHRIAGTSISGSIYSAFQAQTDEQHSQRFGLVNTDLYAAFSTYGYEVYRDITRGCQFQSPSEQGANCAGPGWDFVTGIGSVRGASLSGVL